MYKVKHLNDCGQLVWAKVNGQQVEFPKRKQARQWCRHRMYALDGLRIIHPDGTDEEFTWEHEW